ncbi:MAG: hypothetical protein EHM23_06870 [Acidobacteria bacterium]|nr:MAG: hypothetical protein EHM23_06870 [Acidobacteriota bacterium]
MSLLESCLVRRSSQSCLRPKSWPLVKWCAFVAIVFSVFLPALGTSWKNLGPEAGTVFSLAVDLANPQIVYAGTDGSGVYISRNGGLHWEQAFPDSFVNAIAVDPRANGFVYAGSEAGVHKSTDQGVTWQTAGLDTEDISSLVVSPSGAIWAGTWSNGVFASTDGGLNWSPSSTGLADPNVNALVIDPTNPAVLYAATLTAVFKSVNGGANWTAVLVEPDAFTSLAADSSGNIYAGLAGGDVRKTTNGGTNWAPVNTGLGFDVASLLVDPISSTTVYVGLAGTGVYKSTNSGGSWAAVDSGLPVDCAVLALASGGGAIFAGTINEGVFKSVNGGGFWISCGHFRGTIYALLVNPQNKANIFAAGIDGKVQQSTDMGATWQTVLLGTDPVYSLAADGQNPPVLYAGTDLSGVFKSTDGGATWGPGGLDGVPIYGLWASPTNPSRLLAGTYGLGVHVSTDAGATWDPTNTGLTNTAIFALAVARSNNNIIYVGTDGGGVFKSTDGGLNWQAVNNGLTDDVIWTVAVHPTDPLTAYAGTNTAGIFKTTDGGSNWTAVNNATDPTGLFAVNILAVDSLDPNRVYAGTWGYGLFETQNGGTSWTDNSEGLPSRFVWALGLESQTRTSIYAGTEGGGVAGLRFASFADVAADHIFNPYIVEIAAREITVGCGGGNFCPDSTVTRAQMAVFLEKAMKGSGFVPPAATGIFVDVGTTHWAAAWIEQLFTDQITAGCGADTFCPEDPTTRAAMAVFLLKSKHGATYVPPAASGVFGDVPTSHWAAAWIEQLAAEGITAGCGGGNFCPDSPVTRGQMAVFLCKTFGF